MSIREMDKLLPADCFGFPEICLESDDDGVGGESDAAEGTVVERKTVERMTLSKAEVLVLVLGSNLLMHFVFCGVCVRVCLFSQRLFQCANKELQIFD